LDRQYKKQIQAATSVESKKVDLSAVENMIQTVNEHISEGSNSTDLSVIKGVLNKIKNGGRLGS
jgi:hypothetical protein